MRRRNPKDARALLRRKPSLDELRQEYPAEWQQVERELAAVIREDSSAALESYVTSLTAPAAAKARRTHSEGHARALASAEIRRAMAAAALRQLSLAAGTGTTSGRVRFNLLNGFVAQKLLFDQGLDRKPVSLRKFRAIWPLVWQRRLLMPLVQSKGIYCFYSDQLIARLAAMLGDRPGLEIAAGDGTLSRFLVDEGVSITATDDHSWGHNVRYPETVLKQDARTALRLHRPDVVICSWPPPGNLFEKFVFATESMQSYVAINSQLELGSGNKAAYAEQVDFAFVEDPALSRLVLPPELESVVHVFQREIRGA